MTCEFISQQADFLGLDEIRRVQRNYWEQQALYIRQNSIFYRDYFTQIKLCGELDEIADLPFTDKEMLRKDQQEFPPFGSYLAAQPEQINRMHRTSGTTGSAMNLALTAQMRK